MTEQSLDLEPSRTEAAENQIIIDWIAKRLGTRVERISKQGRWRPAWFVEATKDGEPMRIYVRGERTETFLPYSLEREYTIHRLLEQGGVRTPRLYGFIDELPAVVMEQVSGRTCFDAADDDQVRDTIRRQLVEQMALMHSLDTEPFVKAGLRLPQTPVATTMSASDDLFDNYRSRKLPADPRIEFLAGWTRRHAFPSREPPRFTAADAGQFIFEGTRLKACIDFEMSVLGDPLQDLGIIRIRNSWQPLGDLPSLYRLYSDLTGRAIDLQAIRFHTAAFSLCGAMSSSICLAEYLKNPSPQADYIEFSIWILNSLKQAMEAAAEVMGITLTPPPMPRARPSRFDNPLFALRASLNPVGDGKDEAAYRGRVQLAILSHLERLSTLGAAMEAAYVAEVGDYLGQRPADSIEADAWLQSHVLAAQPEEDENILRLMYADLCRRNYLLVTPGGAWNDALQNVLSPIS